MGFCSAEGGMSAQTPNLEVLMSTAAFNFPLHGGSIPRDHGYQCLSALSRNFEFLHGREDVQIAPIRGTRFGDRLDIDKGSVLHIRGITPEQAAQIGGSWVMLGSGIVGIGQPTAHSIRSSPALASHRVAFRGVFDAEKAQELIRREIGPVGDIDVNRRSSLALKGRKMLGHSVMLSNLPPDVSIMVQSTGIGICTSMGCGVFYPGSLVCRNVHSEAA